MIPPDAAARAQALDITRSFIVQAPAGSGKTELLTQRFLALLGAVEQPETIVAITFTNKAAGEMRTRICDALRLAQGPRPELAHKQATWALAARVLERDRQLEWGLERNSTRLRILTIDALCAQIAAQMPWLSRLGGPPAIARRPGELHEDAARRTLELLESDLGEPVRRLLLHIDNNQPRACGLIASMLARRDQWLRHLGALDRQSLESVLAAIVRQGTESLREALPLGTLRLFSAAFPGEEPTLEALAGFLLTKTGEIRKRVDKSIGFPPGHPGIKEMQELLQGLDPAFAERLHSVRLLPPSSYTDGQWDLIQALFGVLRLATAQLRMVFQERREVDFVEVQLCAIQALGSGDEPTPLAYAMDHRIHHLLIDEFQDTSITKLVLLERLTAEWSAGDGRTLFAVGDPMQSVYSFQEAEVSLFERCRQNGLGRVALTPLQLTANFRSSETMVEWFNETFPRVMGQTNESGSGAVAYAASTATQPPGGSIRVHPVPEKDSAAEARTVADLIDQTPEGSIAVLVRSRPAAHDITRELRRRGVRYQAVELEPLMNRSVVQDLRALTRVLLHPGDRVAQLSILRAPWAGRTLEQLLEAVPLPAVAAAWDDRGRKPLRQWVEDTWRELGGPACLRDEEEREDAETFFEFLESAPADLRSFESALSGAWAPPDPKATSRIQIMTMHKAKGLEFDTVILPGLGRRPNTGDSHLLRWRELNEDASLLIGSLGEFGGEPDRIYAYLGRLEAQRQDHESNRLLYVAATRARRTLHLAGWPGTKGTFSAKLSFLFEDHPAPPAAERVPPEPPPLRRISPDWRRPAPPPALEWSTEEHHVDEEEISYDWSGETLRLVGTAVHAMLQTITREGLDLWTLDHLHSQEPALRSRLISLGVPADELPGALMRTQRALVETIRGDRGRWLLEDHPEARSEWELTAVFGGAVRRFQLDRSFIGEDGVRWIVDYKTSSHEGSDLEAFLANEVVRYRPQLERYAEVVSRLDRRPIRLGLFFPLLGGWREWPFAVSGATSGAEA